MSTLNDMRMGSAHDQSAGRNLIIDTLTNDQCHHGFGNTVTAIRVWLCGCDKEGRKLFLKALAEDDSDLDKCGR